MTGHGKDPFGEDERDELKTGLGVEVIFSGDEEVSYLSGGVVEVFFG